MADPFVCLACDSDRLDPRYRLPYGILQQCRDCGSAITAFFEQTKLAKANSQWGDADHVRGRWLRESEERRNARARLRDLTPWIGQGRLLEIGPSRGEFLMEAEASGFRVSAADLFDVLAPEVRKRCTAIYTGDFLDCQIGERFEVISAFHVLEHMQNPRRFARRVRGLLEIGGLLYLEVPHYESIDRRLLGRHWDMFFDYHLVHFSQRGLVRLVESAEFEPCMIRTHTDPMRYVTTSYFRLRVRAWQVVKRVIRSLSGTSMNPVAWVEEGPRSSRDQRVRSFVKLESAALRALALPLAPVGVLERWLGLGQVIRMIARAV